MPVPAQSDSAVRVRMSSRLRCGSRSWIARLQHAAPPAAGRRPCAAGQHRPAAFQAQVGVRRVARVDAAAVSVELLLVERDQRGRVGRDAGLGAEVRDRGRALLPGHQLGVQVGVGVRPGHRDVARTAVRRPGGRTRRPPGAAATSIPGSVLVPQRSCARRPTRTRPRRSPPDGLRFAVRVQAPGFHALGHVGGFGVPQLPQVHDGVDDAALGAGRLQLDRVDQREQR